MGILEGVDPIFCYLGLTGLAKLGLYYTWKDRRPSNAVYAGRVTGLSLYPLKSAKGIHLDKIECEAVRGAFSGHIPDRYWMVVTEEYDMISSRQEPIISKIETKYDGTTLVLSASGFPDLRLEADEVEQSGKVVSTHVHGVPTKGLDCGDAASKWISEFIGKPGHRLVYSGADIYHRGVIGGNLKYLPWTRVAKTNDKLAFHDSISFHLCAEESMTELNTRLPDPIHITRFRPNIIVSTGNQPFDEDTWHEVFIGDVRFTTLKLCARCVLPNVDPLTGKKEEKDNPLTTLNKYRNLLPGLGPAFGIDLVVERPGSIRVNDRIYIVRGDNISKP